MSLDSARQRFERRQRDLFRAEARLVRPASTATLNTTSGVETPAAATLVFKGPCLIRGMGWEGMDVEQGGRETRLRRYRVKFPANTGEQANDVVSVISSLHDPSLADRTMRVTDVVRDDWQISRWSICEEVTADV